MSDEHRSIEEIERDIELKRANIGAGIAELQDRLSPEKIVSDAKSVLQQNFAEFAEPVARAARTNPLAVALIGVGLAWLLASASRPATGKVRQSFKKPAPMPNSDPDWLRHDSKEPISTIPSRSPASSHPRPAWAYSSNKEF